jgi:hypothetical protein
MYAYKKILTLDNPQWLTYWYPVVDRNEQFKICKIARK